MKLPVFDPKTVPTVALAPLPKVPAQALTAPALLQRFQNPPAWQPEIRSEPAFSSRPHTQAAVLIGLVQRQELMVLLTQRTAAMSTHAGQVAFPVGKVDPQDKTAVDAALREAHEETGLHPQKVSVLGSLPDYTTGTNFRVQPVVALIEPSLQLRANPHEVAAIFEVPLSFLMNPANHRYHQLRWEDQTRHWYSMPYTHEGSASAQGERFIWGATAGMLRNLYHFLSA